ncbi:uncharacterized protein LY89DRAFT_737628 [Mollisia scopiformis]|uniref:Uncharacterized protein n=1 Tax=Mollisia scopiformis TaxID=149040 RepID=A0A194WXK0_MOLSC|nr:uncharacterized protein LY89DRAFT_737628 [Mollisia scopiformis]KUJ12708.1 hypothetical protein LY89DRAFT_737628 [Mollisia scopiformis]
MERDIRRARGQWRGCYAFEDIICDGDGGSSPKRTGGLKMGSTYYYYYELDDGTEHYDATISFTTSCPYLPGQPVNLLYVPVEVQPLRYRSASMSSMAIGDIKTMNPADKFMTPRQPPPLPALPRLNTATSVLTKKRSARSLSPNGDKSPWSPRTFFGLLSPLQQSDNRGRSSSLSKMSQSSADRSTPSLKARPDEMRKVRSVPQTRDASPHSFKSKSREASPFRQAAVQEHHFSATTFSIPDEIAEEAEDDDNFASHVNRISMNEKGIFTPLAPPPSRQRSPPARASTAKDTAKPLPQLPEEDNLMPSPLRLRTVASAAELPRSHFSTSTISTNFTSPSDSQFSFSEEELNDEDLTTDMGSGDEFTYSPILAETPLSGRFSGYSLPKAEYASKQTLRNQTPLSPFREPASRTTFGGPSATYTSTSGNEPEHMSALEQLLSEMGYLGDVIVGK